MGHYGVLSCHRRPWRSHLRSTPCCRSCNSNQCANRATRSTTPPWPPGQCTRTRARAIQRTGPTTLRYRGQRAPRNACSGGGREAAKQRQGAAAGFPNRWNNLRTSTHHTTEVPLSPCIRTGKVLQRHTSGNPSPSTVACHPVLVGDLT